MFCPSCGKQVDAGAGACPFCGEPLPAPKHAKHFSDPDATIAAAPDPDATVFAAPPTTVLDGDETQLVSPAAPTTVTPATQTTVVPLNAVESSPYADPEAAGSNGKPPREPWPTWQKVLLGAVIVAVVALVVVLATRLLPKGPAPATPATSVVATTTPAATPATTAPATTPATTPAATTPATTQEQPVGSGHELTTGSNGLQTYRNGRYGFSFTLPEGIDPHEVLTEGDVETGLSAVNLDTQTCIKVWAEPNNTGTASPKKLLDDFCEGRTMTYSELGDNWYVASWIDADNKNVGYRKVFVGSSTLEILEYNYPKADEEAGGKMVKYSLSSFEPGNLDR